MIKIFIMIVTFIISVIIVLSFIRYAQLGFIAETIILIGFPIIIPFITLKWFNYVFNFMKPRPIKKKRMRHESDTNEYSA